MTSSGNNKANVLFNKQRAANGIDDVWDDTELIKMYERSTAKAYEILQNDVNVAKGPSSTLPKKWKVGDSCMAPYEEDGKWYRAAIKAINPDGSGTCQVNYTGYGDHAVATIKLLDLMEEEEVEWVGDEHGTEQEDAGGQQQSSQHVENKEKEDVAAAEPSSTTNNNNVGGGNFMIPNHCPPPPPSMFENVVSVNSEKEAYTNALMSWYMAGYHTGFYQGMMHQKKKPGNSSN